MKRLIVLIGLLVVSCDYFEKKKIKTEDIVIQELEDIDWNAVDQYPSFSLCDTLIEKSEQKHCFETTILNHVNTYLSQQHIVVSTDVEDVIELKLSIDNTGEISVLNTKIKPETLEVIPEIESLLKGSLKSLPQIFPAIKRGQKVSTEFVLPVVVSIK